MSEERNLLSCPFDYQLHHAHANPVFSFRVMGVGAVVCHLRTKDTTKLVFLFVLSGCAPRLGWSPLNLVKFETKEERFFFQLCSGGWRGTTCYDREENAILLSNAT